MALGSAAICSESLLGYCAFLKPRYPNNSSKTLIYVMSCNKKYLWKVKFSFSLSSKPICTAVKGFFLSSLNENIFVEMLTDFFEQMTNRYIKSLFFPYGSYNTECMCSSEMALLLSFALGKALRHITNSYRNGSRSMNRKYNNHYCHQCIC